MFYTRKQKDFYFLKNDKTFGEFGPFLAVYSKNKLFGENIFGIDLEKFPAYKYALGFTKKRLFILDNEGNIQIKLFNS